MIKPQEYCNSVADTSLQWYCKGGMYSWGLGIKCGITNYLHG